MGNNKGELIYTFKNEEDVSEELKKDKKKLIHIYKDKDPKYAYEYTLSIKEIEGLELVSIDELREDEPILMFVVENSTEDTRPLMRVKEGVVQFYEKEIFDADGEFEDVEQGYKFVN